MIIAIDGHSSCGKSTLAKDLANTLHIRYIDSGAMYRAVCVYCLENNIDPHNIAEISSSLSKIQIEMEYSNGEVITILNGRDISHQIRNMEVSAIVSEISSHSIVRKKMVELQRTMSDSHSVVMDGRDIGTVVFPKAEYKFFLTADLDIRAMRRYTELIRNGVEVDLDEIKRNLVHRDHIDSTRHDSPLIQAEDAILIDNSTLTRQEQLELSLSYIKPF